MTVSTSIDIALRAMAIGFTEKRLWLKGFLISGFMLHPWSKKTDDLIQLADPEKDITDSFWSDIDAIDKLHARLGLELKRLNGAFKPFQGSTEAEWYMRFLVGVMMLAACMKVLVDRRVELSK